MENSPLVKISRLSQNFTEESGKSKWALRNISFEIIAGEFLSIVGPSGCGKSTLLRIISNLVKPTDGAVSRNFRKPAMVFQNFALFPWLQVTGNTEFGLKMAGVEKQKRQRVTEEKIAEAGLRGFEKKFPKELSGGERQRVGLARALSVSPDLLLMDEPFSSLDSIISDKLKKDVTAIWQKYKMTVVMVNHLISDAIELSDRIIVMNGQPGEIKEIIELNEPRPRNNRSKEFFELQDKIANLMEK